MFIRFTILRADADTKKNTGVLVAGHTLRDEGDLTVEEHRRLRVCLEWFNKNLHIPSTYKDIQNKRALSWFKPAAAECIERMWELKQILDDHGLHVEVLKTRTPGKIVYEDGWQVIALPTKGQRFQ